MAYPYQELEAAGVDIAGLVNEKFLNNFSVSHHKVNPSLYQGSDFTDEIGDRVEVSYKVARALRFDMNPISESRFRSLYEAHLIAKGMDPANKTRLFSIPANLKLESKGVDFAIAVIDSSTGNDIVRVPFNWDMEARCAVTLHEENGTYSVRLDPLKVEFSAGQSSILLEIHKAILNDKTKKSLDDPKQYKSQDPE